MVTNLLTRTLTGSFAPLGCGKGATVGVKTNLLGLVRVCACVNAAAINPILTIGGSEQACPSVRVNILFRP